MRGIGSPRSGEEHRWDRLIARRCVTLFIIYNYFRI